MSAAALPPFTLESAAARVRMAEDAWNSRDPERVSLAYSIGTRWRNRTEFMVGRAAVQDFLRRKWQHELEYRLIKQLWGFRENRIAVRFAYEWCNTQDQWFRSYGNENWEFDSDGLMQRRIASINDAPIDAAERRFLWPLGPRPTQHASLEELGF